MRHQPGVLGLHLLYAADMLHRYRAFKSSAAPRRLRSDRRFSIALLVATGVAGSGRG